METDSFSNLNDGDKDKNKEVDLFSSGSLLTSLPCIDLHAGLKICSLILNLEKLPANLLNGKIYSCVKIGRISH